MEENTLLSLGRLFEQLSDRHHKIAGFYYGSLLDTLAALRSNDKVRFPLLFLEVPDLVLEDNGHGHVVGKRMVSFGLMVRYENLNEGDNTPGERPKIEAFAQAEQLALEVYRVLRKWQQAKGYDLVGTPQFASVEGITTGKDVGFMGEMVIQKEMDTCPDDSQWEGLIDGQA